MATLLKSLVVSYLAISSCFAGEEIQITSVADGQVPYMVVTNDPKGGSSRQPGIYSNQGSSWLPVVLGDVLRGKASNGVIEQLASTKITRRYESLSIVDGRVVLFRFDDESATDKKAPLVLGENLPVLDAVTLSPIQLPVLRNYDDVRIVSSPVAAGQGGQVVILSIRTPNSPYGTGLTIAFLMQNDFTVPSAYLIDHVFYARESLSSLVRYGASDVLSGLWVDRLANSSVRPARAAFIETWAKEIRGFVQRIRTSGGHLSIDDGYPTFDLLSGRPEIHEPPVGEFNSELDLMQYFDPITQEAYIAPAEVGSVAAPDGSDFKLPGAMIDPIHSSSHAVLTTLKDVALLSVNGGQLVLVLESEDLTDKRDAYRYVYLDEDRESAPAKSMSFEFYPMKDAKGEVHEGILLVSRQYESEGETDAFLVSMDPRTKTSLKTISLLDVALSPTLLKARVRKVDGDRDGHVDRLFFDARTKPEAGISSYHALVNENQPMVNVLSSLQEEDIQEGFFKPLEAKSILEGFEYRQYEDEHLDDRLTGLYDVKKDSEKPLVQGELLKVVAAGGQMSPHLAAKSMTIGKTNDSVDQIKITLNAFDPLFDEGKRSFKLAVLSEATVDNHLIRGTPPITVDVNYPFTQLRSVRIVQGDKKRVSEFAVFLGFEISDETFLTQVLYFAVEPKGEARVPTPRLVKVSKAVFNDKTNEQIEKLLYFGEDGLVYLNTTPDQQPKTANWKLLNPVSGDSFSPYRNGSGNIRLRSYTEEVQKYDTSGDGFDNSSNAVYWTVISARELEGALKISKKDETKEKEESDKLDEKKKKHYAEFAEKLDEILTSPIPRHTLFLVPDSKEKTDLLQALQFAAERKSKYPFSLNRSDIDFYVVRGEKVEQSGLLNLYQRIHGRQVKRKSLIFADAKEIQEIGVPVNEDESTTEKLPSGQNPHFIHILSNEGRIATAKEGGFSKISAPRIPTVIVATADEWSAMQKEAGKVEGQREAFEARLKVDLSFMSTLWSLTAKDQTPELRKMSEQGLTSSQEKILPGLIEQARAAADLKQKPSRKVILLPDELVPFARRILLTKWASASDKEPWSQANPQLKLNEYQYQALVDGTIAASKPMTQSLLMKRLSESRSAPGKRSVMFSTLSEIRQNARPGFQSSGEVVSFKISDPAMKDEDRNREVPPSILYLFLDQGRKEQPKSSLIGDQPQLDDFSQLLIGTKNEWQALRNEAHLEERLGLFDTYEVIEIDAPSDETKVSMLKEVLDRPSIRSLGYRYDLKSNGESIDLKGFNNEEMKERLLQYLVSRAHMVAKQVKDTKNLSSDTLSSFIRVMDEFSRAVVEDPTVRKTKIVDRNFVERLIAKTFVMPLNMNILPSDDLLVRIKDTNKAALEMQKNGYEGPLELKQKFFSTILAQTLSVSGRTIPASILIWGDSSTGKTYLPVVFSKMMKLKEYDFSPDAKNDDAQSFFFNLGRIGSGDENKSVKSSSDTLTVEEYIEHFRNFLAGPNGHRGVIVLDDLHKAAPKDLKLIIAFINSLFEAPGGIIRIHAKGGVRDVPVRNLILIGTLNPTNDQEKLSRYVKKNTDEEIIIATLSTTDNPVEVSFLKRWSLLLNLSKFPLSAKIPALHDELRKNSQNEFNTGGRYVLSSSRAVNAVANQFSDANVREFTSTAAGSMIGIVPAHLSSRYFVIVPKETPVKIADDQIPMALGGRSVFDAAGRDEAGISKYIASNLTAVPLADSLEGKLELADVMVDVLRTTAYEAFSRSLVADTRYASNPIQGERYLAPLLEAIKVNLMSKPFIPPMYLNLDVKDMEIPPGAARKQLSDLILKRSQNGSNFYPFKFADQYKSDALIRQLSDYSFVQSNERSRVNAITEAADRAMGPLIRLAEGLMRVKSLKSPEDAATWLKSLSEDDPKGLLREVGQLLVNQYMEFVVDVSSGSVLENADPNVKVPNSFEYGLFFMTALDRAISRLPWAKMSTHMINAIRLAGNDINYGQMPGVQHYFFDSKYSFLRPAIHDIIFQVALSSDAYQKWSEKPQNRDLKSLDTGKCSQFLLPPPGALGNE